MTSIAFQLINWDQLDKTAHSATQGTAHWQTVQFGGLRIRVVEYSAGYMADHWCKKGHIVYCLEGEFVSELDTGETFTLRQGTSYVVSDDVSTHRLVKSGVKLLIIDGDFLHVNNMPQQ